MSRPKITDSAKLQKENPEFADEVNGLSVDALNAKLAQLAKDGEAVEDAKEADEELARIRDEAKLMADPYRDARKVLRLKSRYVINLIKEKGGT